MDILVTGATGFVGRAVVTRLMARGDNVRALILPGTDHSSLDGLGVTLCEGDIVDRGSVARAARGVGAVIHTAAYVSLYSRRLEEMRRVNVVGVENVASVALEVGAERLVHVSSVVAVGASETGEPVDEDFAWPFDEVDIPYVLTKREGELTAFRYARLGMEVVVVNPCMVVGAPDCQGTDPGGILKFLRRERPFRTGGGASFVDVEDVAAGIVSALERGRNGQRYILGNENLTFESFYDLLEEVSGVPAPRWTMPHGILARLARGGAALERWTGLPSVINPQIVWLSQWKWFANCALARQELGLPQTPIRESVARAVAFYRDRGMV